MNYKPLLLLAALCCLTSAEAKKKKTSGNPIFPGWYADPEGTVMDGRYWVFPTYSAPYGALCAFLVTVLTEVGGYSSALRMLMTRLPLASVGLGWLIPSLLAAAAGALVGAFVPRKHRSLHKGNSGELASPAGGAVPGIE